MICRECGSERVIWIGPLSALTHTECQDCGTWDSSWSNIFQTVFDEDESWLFGAGGTPGDE